MKYFLTGATGFIGGVLARQLVEAGHHVVAVVRSPGKAQELQALGVTLAPGDVTEKESLRAAMTGVDGVFHVAGWYKIGIGDKSQGQKVNVDGTRNVLELMQELKIPRGVYTSTLAINSDTHGRQVDETYRFNGKHITEYDRTKAEAHAIAERFIAQGLPLVIVMPGLVYGPGDTSILRATLIQFLQRKLPVMPQQTAYSWGYVQDIAHAHVLAMEKGRPGESYIICGPTHTMVEAVQLGHRLTGVPMPKAVPPGMLRAMAVFMGLLEPVIPLPQTYTSEGLRAIAGVTYIGDNAKARRELGYAPRPLEDGLRTTLEHEMKLLKG